MRFQADFIYVNAYNKLWLSLKLSKCSSKPLLTLFRTRIGAKKVPHTSFSPAASTNVGIIPKNFLTFSFQPFCHTNVKFQDHAQCHSQIIELEPRAPLKKIVFFWSNPYILKVMITSLIEMLDSHRNAITKLWSHDHSYNITWVL